MKKLLSIIGSIGMLSGVVTNLSACSAPFANADKSDLSTQAKIVNNIKTALSLLRANGYKTFNNIVENIINKSVFGYTCDLTHLDINFYSVDNQGEKTGNPVNLDTVIMPTSYIVVVSAQHDNYGFYGSTPEILFQVGAPSLRDKLSADNDANHKIMDQVKIVSELNRADHKNNFLDLKNNILKNEVFGQAKDLENILITFYNVNADGQRGEAIVKLSDTLKIQKYYVSISATKNNNSFIGNLHDVLINIQDTKKDLRTTLQITNKIQEKVNLFNADNARKIQDIQNDIASESVFGKGKDLTNLNVLIFKTKNGVRDGDVLPSSMIVETRTYVICVSATDHNNDFKGTTIDMLFTTRINLAENSFFTQRVSGLMSKVARDFRPGPDPTNFIKFGLMLTSKTVMGWDHDTDNLVIDFYWTNPDGSRGDKVTNKTQTISNQFYLVSVTAVNNTTLFNTLADITVYPFGA